MEGCSLHNLSAQIFLGRLETKKIVDEFVVEKWW